MPVCVWSMFIMKSFDQYQVCGVLCAQDIKVACENWAIDKVRRLIKSIRLPYTFSANGQDKAFRIESIGRFIFCTMFRHFWWREMFCLCDQRYHKINFIRLWIYRLILCLFFLPRLWSNHRRRLNGIFGCEWRLQHSITLNLFLFRWVLCMSFSWSRTSS